MTRMNMNKAVYEALFASPVQPSDTLTAEAVANEIGSTVLRLGASGCKGYTAEEFGNHPQEAADRMRWIRQLISELNGCLYFPTAPLATTTSVGTDMLPVREAA